MKKIVSLLLTLPVLFATVAMAFGAAAGPAICFDGVYVEPGETFSVELHLTGNPGIAGLVVSLEYDETALDICQVESGRLFSGFTMGTNYMWDESKNIAKDGVLMTLTCKASEDAAGKYPIKVIVRQCVSTEGSVALTAETGAITISHYDYGDANGDGQKDITDMACLYDYLSRSSNIGQISNDAEFLAIADANDDGVVNILDYQALYESFLR